MLTGLTGSKRLRSMAADIAALRASLDQAAAQIAAAETILSDRVRVLEDALNEARDRAERAEARLAEIETGLDPLRRGQDRLDDIDRHVGALQDRTTAIGDTQQRHDRAITRLDRRLDAQAEDARTTATGLIERIDAVRHTARAD